MIVRDYHHYTVDEALADASRLVGYVRTSGRIDDAEFIVGHGQIQHRLIALLNSYGLIATVKLSNTGVVRCLIE